jgi:hypothetical protein
MITHRPDHLLADAAYRTLPAAPLSLDWSLIPELVRVVTLDLSGVQPPTKAMANAAGGEMHDKPSEGEIKLFQARATTFQLVSMVVNLIPGTVIDGARHYRPYSVTLIPGSKRGNVQTTDINFISKLDLGAWPPPDLIYSHYDPFTGHWSTFGAMPDYFDGKREGFLDEVGVVIDQFFLATHVPGDDEILIMDLRMPSEEETARYAKYRKKLFFKPFEKVEARRIWGAETAIELFMIQALANDEHYPECQVLIMNDGTTFPSLFHLWRDPNFRKSEDIITSVDLYFPTERVAVFCDGGNHARRKHKGRDKKIDAALTALGIRPVRVLGSAIKTDLAKAVTRVKDVLAARP